MQQGLYPGITLPVTPGSDGAGITDAREVIINPGLFWGDSELYQGSHFNVLGMPVNGTFAEKVLVPEENIYDKPTHLSWEEAAALPLAGVTAYRALFVQGEAKPGEKVLISGVGGGVALMAMQFALAHGMEVSVTSGNDDKLERAKAMGVTSAMNYKEHDWTKKLTTQKIGFDLILDSAGGESFSHLQKLVKPGGRMIVYGGTLGKIHNLSPQILYWRQMTIRGTTMGSQKDFAAMLSFVNTHRIKPIVDSVYTLEDTNAALAKLRDSTQFGKVVIRIAP
jgi:NADPH:quinone reductase-like Zn-dependent oxidoreductase